MKKMNYSGIGVSIDEDLVEIIDTIIEIYKGMQHKNKIPPPFTNVNEFIIEAIIELIGWQLSNLEDIFKKHPIKLEQIRSLDDKLQKYKVPF